MLTDRQWRLLVAIAKEGKVDKRLAAYREIDPDDKRFSVKKIRASSL